MQRSNAKNITDELALILKDNQQLMSELDALMIEEANERELEVLTDTAKPVKMEWIQASLPPMIDMERINELELMLEARPLESNPVSRETSLSKQDLAKQVDEQVNDMSLLYASLKVKDPTPVDKFVVPTINPEQVQKVRRVGVIYDGMDEEFINLSTDSNDNLVSDPIVTSSTVANLQSVEPAREPDTFVYTTFKTGNFSSVQDHPIINNDSKKETVEDEVSSVTVTTAIPPSEPNSLTVTRPEFLPQSQSKRMTDLPIPDWLRKDATKEPENNKPEQTYSAANKIETGTKLTEPTKIEVMPEPELVNQSSESVEASFFEPIDSTEIKSITSSLHDDNLNSNREDPSGLAAEKNEPVADIFTYTTFKTESYSVSKSNNDLLNNNLSDNVQVQDELSQEFDLKTNDLTEIAISSETTIDTLSSLSELITHTSNETQTETDACGVKLADSSEIGPEAVENINKIEMSDDNLDAQNSRVPGVAAHQKQEEPKNGASIANQLSSASHLQDDSTPILVGKYASIQPVTAEVKEAHYLPNVEYSNAKSNTVTEYPVSTPQVKNTETEYENQLFTELSISNDNSPQIGHFNEEEDQFNDAFSYEFSETVVDPETDEIEETANGENPWLTVLVLLSTIWVLFWFNQNSINTYFQQKYHQSSPLELFDEINLWHNGRLVSESMTKVLFSYFPQSEQSQVSNQPNDLKSGLVKEVVAGKNRLPLIIASSDENKLLATQPEIVAQNNVVENTMDMSAAIGAGRSTDGTLRKIGILNVSDTAANQKYGYLLTEGEKVFFAGDSLMQGVAPHVMNKLKKEFNISSVNLSKQSTGLTYPKSFNWLTTIEKTLEENNDIGLLVMMLGANDPWDMQVKKGEPYLRFASESWNQAYLARIDTIYKLAAAKGIGVIWISAPSMKKDKLNTGVLHLDILYKAMSEQYGGIYLDSNIMFGYENNTYSAFSVWNDKKTKIRADDGVHFTPTGQRIIAEYVLSVIGVIRPTVTPQIESESVAVLGQ